MTNALAPWNQLSSEDAVQQLLACCGSQAWARGLASRRPFADQVSLLRASDEVWWSLSPSDWREAFSRHPRIGERKSPAMTSAQSAAWSAEEQQEVAAGGEAVQAALAKGNREYERRFNRVFIVCAAGKSAPEILEILRRRLVNDEATELREAAEEQRKITTLRLTKWLST
jgi:2-oxo-4-hydroxy-4-carboxy-5-ureidoimidazoline decarboxylase